MNHKQVAFLISVVALLAGILACNASGFQSDSNGGRDAEVTLTAFIDPTLLTPAMTPTTDTTNIPDSAEATPTEAPTPTGCGYWSGFVSDVTIPDGTEVPAGETFEKTWELRNTGCLTWPADLQLVFLQGDQMSGPETQSVPIAAPGDTVEVSVDMTAPIAPGEYVGYWQLIAPGQVSVGPPFYVEIQVVAAAWQPFTGKWTNTDRDDPEHLLDRVEISNQDGELLIHRWDNCTGQPCDAGEQTVSLADAEDGTLILNWAYSDEDGTVYMRETQLFTILGDGRLQIVGQRDYLDDRGEDVTFTEYFAKPEPESE